MSYHDVWILMEKSALNALWAAAYPPLDAEGFPTTPVPDNAKLLSHGAIRGFWKDLPDSGNNYEVVNVARQGISEIDAFIQTHAVDIFAAYGWTQGNGLDNTQSQDSEGNTVGYPTIPQGVLDVMQDHVTHDIDGNETSRIPATFDNPNWGHKFLGQKDRIFAGDYNTDDYNEDFL